MVHSRINKAHAAGACCMRRIIPQELTDPTSDRPVSTVKTFNLTDTSVEDNRFCVAAYDLNTQSLSILSCSFIINLYELVDFGANGLIGVRQGSGQVSTARVLHGYSNPPSLMYVHMVY